jgi:hypothetical protein
MIRITLGRDDATDGERCCERVSAASRVTRAHAHVTTPMSLLAIASSPILMTARVKSIGMKSSYRP